jgi:macrolide transport system ATP-binding/permease protein
MIRLTDIRKTYRLGGVEVPALRGVDLAIEAGEYVAIMGPSGSGKSTLMHILGLLDTPSTGSFLLFDREIASLPEDDLSAARAGLVGFVFQQFNLLPRLSALENVALPLTYVGANFSTARAAGLLRATGLGDRTSHRPAELSGGQQQRVAIARALVNGPRLILADEPTGNLDSTSSGEIMALFDELNGRGITVILVTHEEEIAAHARRVIRLRDGVIQSDTRREPAAPRPRPAEAQTDTWSAARRPRVHLRELASFFRQAGRALAGNKTRTLLSMLGVLIGVAAVIAMLGLGRGAQLSIEQQLASLGSNLLVLRPGATQMRGVMMEAGAATRLSTDDAQAIAETLPAVRRVAPGVQGAGQLTYGGRNWRSRVIGTTPPYASMRAAEPAVGRFFTDHENQTRARVAVLGMTPVRELFGDANPIGEFIKINRISFQVIGILPYKGASSWRDEDDTVIIPLDTAMRRLLGRDYVDNIDIEVRSSAEMEAAQEAITGLLRRRHRIPAQQPEGFQIRNLAEIQAALSETSRTMSMLLAVIAAVSLLVGGIGIMNIMLVSVTERTREIGIRKAIGARRRDILAQFLIEAITVSATGGLLGIALGWGITLALSRFAGWTTAVTPSSIALAFLFASGVGILFGLWPARKAARLHPVEALRYE